MDLSQVSFSYFIQALAVLIIIWEAVKKIVEIKKASDEDHERKQGWDYAFKTIKVKEKEWDSGLSDIDNTRKEIIKKYDDKLSELEEKIDENKNDEEAKIQELKVELFIQTECMKAVLDGLHQLNCNGPVTEARKLLDTYLSSSAHDINDIEKLLKRGI